MKVVKTPAEATAACLASKRAGRTLGLVPTMGALHEGHLSLVRKAREECDCVAVSIFVNPTQFGEGEDLDAYPRALERDLELCDEEGADLVLTPTKEEMYLPGYTTWVEVGELSQKLEGLSRPSHFRGVTTVVSKLFNIFLPDRAYFGQKDLQQLVVIRRMARDLSFPVTVVACPIVREEDGLAMSSRNSYLSKDERAAALCLSAAIKAFGESVAEGERDVSTLLETLAEPVIAEPLAVLDYAAIVDAETLEDVKELSGAVAAALAVWFGNTRLIDNVIISAG
ncbi:MAG: pantoate--beta-alanine ligase [Planctomycetota bacterium]|jgi:pantoate--beta-alanine ligase